MKCNGSKCKTCDIILDTDGDGKDSATFNCKSKNVVYIITCKICFKQYVGQTGRCLSERMNNHRSTIKLKYNTSLAKHFNEHSNQQFNVRIIETVPDITSRLKRERYWQQTLNTIHPNGFNDELHFHPQKQRFSDKWNLFRPQSVWTPSDKQISNGTLDTIRKMDQIFDDYFHIKSTNVDGSTKNKDARKANMTREEKDALQQLSSMNDIIIKQADKGGCITIMNKDDYLFEVHNQLQQMEYYKRIHEPLKTGNSLQINEILKEMHSSKIINDKNLKYFWANPVSARDRIFYILPKIHKESSKWTIPNKMPPGRPIISNCSSETKNIARMINRFINPLAEKTFTYIKDSYDFKKKIENIGISRDDFLVTGDVEALYTNMNHKRTIESIRKVFELFPDIHRPDQYILRLLEILLKNNDFVFGDDRYLQILGMAMGADFAPGAANIYLRDLDHGVRNRFHAKIAALMRFIDDIFIVWKGNLTQLKELERFMNGLIPGIRIKLSYSRISVNYLDMTVFKAYDPVLKRFVLRTSIHFKPTDSHSLLVRSSYHPKHTFLGIIKSQFIRFARLSSCETDYYATSNFFIAKILERGYNKSFLRKVKAEVFKEYFGKDEIANKEKKNDKHDKILPLIFPYGDKNTDFLQKVESVLKENQIFAKYKIIKAYTIDKNLGSRIISSKLK